MPQTATANPASSNFSDITLTGSTTSSSLFSYTTADVISNLNLNNVQIQNFTNNANDLGAVFNMNATGAVLNVTAGGTTGLTIADIVGVGTANQAAVVVQGGTINFFGDITFANNSNVNSAAALYMYNNSGSVTFNGSTVFEGNSNTNLNGLRGGAIRIQSANNEVLTFNGPTTFLNNFHDGETGQGAGGSIFELPLDEGFTNVIFNNTVTFNGNYASGTSNPLGGAIYAGGNAVFDFNAAAIFSNNYVITKSGGNGGNGGAVRNSGATFNFVSGSEFLNNAASGIGGAIESSGLINLNAITSNILFQGNRQGVQFVGTTPTAGTGVPNAIYIDNATGTLVLNAVGTAQIIFDDPIYAVAGSTITKTGSGTVVFQGDNGVDTLYDSDVLGNTTVQAGTFSLVNGAKYGDTTSGTLEVANGATVSGDAGSSLRAQTLTIDSGGTVDVVSGTLTLDAPAINLASGAELSGNGILAATSNINLAAGALIGNVAPGNTLNVTATLVGAGGVTVQESGTLQLSAANTYTGATEINAGTLQAGIANAFADSSAVNV
ncbi:autotransporter-associated beta strand repeat-containing protein, partial [Herbaspirillum sp. Sphag1AN]